MADCQGVRESEIHRRYPMMPGVILPALSFMTNTAGDDRGGNDRWGTAAEAAEMAEEAA